MDVWPPDLAPDDRYVPLLDLVTGGLPDRISRRMGGAPLRVGQSTAVLGIASRLWSITVVSAVRDGLVVDPEHLVARDDDGSVVLGLTATRAVTTDDDVLAVILAVLGPVVAALPLSPRLLWGNVAASLHAVPRLYDDAGLRPLVARLLGEPPLAGELDLDAVDDGGRARRRTCCLFYEVPGAGLCADCVLARVPSRS